MRAIAVVWARHSRFAGRRWLDAGAEHIIIGTAAVEFVKQLPRDRVIVALDAVEGEVVVNGWTTKTKRRIVEQMELLRPYVSSFLVTFVECEGRMDGTRLDLVASLVEAAGDARVTIAGGVTTSDDIRRSTPWARMLGWGWPCTPGAWPAEVFAAPFQSDREDGLWPTVVVDAYDRAGFCYSNLDSLQVALSAAKACTGPDDGDSGQRRVQRQYAATPRHSVDRDRDTLRFRVAQEGAGFCHLRPPVAGAPRRTARPRRRPEQRVAEPPGILHPAAAR